MEERKEGEEEEGKRKEGKEDRGKKERGRKGTQLFQYRDKHTQKFK